MLFFFFATVQLEKNYSSLSEETVGFHSHPSMHLNYIKPSH